MFKFCFNIILITAILLTWICSSALIGPRIGCVDILEITNQFIKKEALKNHSPSEKELAIKKFSHQLEEALTELSTSKHLILVPREAVIKGCADYTNFLKDRMHLEPNS